MELYTFTNLAGAQGMLRVKADHAVDLTPGFYRVAEDAADGTTIHAFTVIEKIKSEVVGGEYYSWYAVKDYSRTIDRVTVVAQRVESNVVTSSIAFVTLAESGAIDPVTAGEHSDVFAEWQPGINYTVGNIRRYSKKLYKCLQAHTSQDGWEPDVAASLWKNIADPAEEWPEWSQPIGAHDAYQSGDKVSHAGKHWVSTADNNVWEPGTYGWKEAGE